MLHRLLLQLLFVTIGLRRFIRYPNRTGPRAATRDFTALCAMFDGNQPGPRIALPSLAESFTLPHTGDHA